MLSLSLPAGEARVERPSRILRYEFDQQIFNRDAQADGSIIPIEAVAQGDTQVLAASEPFKPGTPVINLDVLSDFPSVESVVASTRVEATRPLPHIRELLLHPWAPLPSAETLRNLPGLEVLFAKTTNGHFHLDLDALNGPRMRKLGFNRWLTKNVPALDRMTGLEHLSANLFREPLDPVGRMPGMKRLTINGPAKGWAKLGDCTLLEQASLIDVDIANLKRWNRWKHLRVLTLSGRSIKSLEGLDAFEQLEDLTLLNTRTNRLEPLRNLQHLTRLTLRMPAIGVDIDSIAAIPDLRALRIEDGRMQTLKPLAHAPALEEVTIYGLMEDGDLSPVDRLPGTRQIRALNSEIEIHAPAEGMKQWSIFESFAERMNLETNYAAEKAIRGAIKNRDPELAKRLDWDTEAGAVGAYAESESDIRRVAEIIEDLLKTKAG